MGFSRPLNLGLYFILVCSQNKRMHLYTENDNGRNTDTALFILVQFIRLVNNIYFQEKYILVRLRCQVLEHNDIEIY